MIAPLLNRMDITLKSLYFAKLNSSSFCIQSLPCLCNESVFTRGMVTRSQNLPMVKLLDSWRMKYDVICNYWWQCIAPKWPGTRLYDILYYFWYMRLKNVHGPILSLSDHPPWNFGSRLADICSISVYPFFVKSKLGFFWELGYICPY